MCGIIGYIGPHEASPIIVEALRRLEYRGYDSAGIATVNNGALDRRRTTGRINNLADALVRNPLRGKIGIGHTRWATHGSPSEKNAHPHHSTSVSVVHNGIIENFQQLKETLIEKGYEFVSETDTETVSVLVQSYLDNHYDPLEAVQRAIQLLQGQFALCFLFAGEEDVIIVARKGSPLVIGHGNNSIYIASDALGLAGLTNNITYLEEGDTAFVSLTEYNIYNANNKKVARKKTRVSIDMGIDLIGDYKHYMIKEIHEQPQTISKVINSLFQPDQLNAKRVSELCQDEIDRINLIGCGTASYACQIASYWFEELLKVPTRAEIASEFRYRNAVLGSNDLSIFVSQSGETADTLAALRYVAEKKSNNLSILNNPSSSMERESKRSLSIHAGFEFSVASTKAFTGQLTLLAGLALIIGKNKGIISSAEFDAIQSDLHKLPELASLALGLQQDIIKIAEFLSDCPEILFIGRGVMFPTSLEGALKLKEITYLHAEGMAAGELKHGPIALIDKRVPTVVLAPYNDLFVKTLSNLKEIRARSGPIILLSDSKGVSEAVNDTQFTLTLPKVNSSLAPILYSIPLQLLAYYTATKKGLDVDKPRHLAKSVTVE